MTPARGKQDLTVAPEARSFGYLLRRYRLAALLTQEQLAERAHLSYRTISDLERGAKHSPRRDTVLLLADALELAPQERASLIAAAHPMDQPPEAPELRAEQESPPVNIHTFLIADVRGYAGFTEAHGDNAAARLATRFVALVRECVESHEGRLVETRGDEVLVAFSSARQALRSAVDLQQRFSQQTIADTTLPLKVGMGLDAGEAIAVEGGYRGTALNLAARLCSLAGPGEVLVSDGVVHLARKVQGLGYVERGAVQLKGFADPVRVVQVVPDEAEETLGKDASEAVPQRPLPVGGFLGALPASPLVARAGELRTVLAAVDAVADSTGRVVFLAGEPGVGKTRLAQEITLHLRKRGFQVATGRCYETQEAVPFYPFLEVLEGLYVAAPLATRSAVPQRWPYLGRLLPNENLPIPPTLFEGKEEQEWLFWSVTSFVQALAQEHPVAFLLDDLQWADASSLALLQHLARHTRAYCVLLLGTYRDVEVGRQHSLDVALRDLNREQLMERVAIRRLGQDGTSELIATSFGQEVSTEFAALVYRCTEGNPYFTHEVLRTLVERGDIYPENGRWERREIEELSVPESVRSAIKERLSRLAEETQGLLHEASVLGQAFWFDDLQAMGDRGEEKVERALEEAEAAGLVRATWNDDYSFNHALTQQAIYADLSPRRKRRLHLAAAEAQERLLPRRRERRTAELAQHFLQGKVPERALPYMLLAGDQAEAVFAHAEAERQYRKALELARALEDRARETTIQEKLGRVLVRTARFDEALEALERAVERHHVEGNRESEARATIDIADALSGKGQVDEAVARVEQILKALEGTGASPAHARLYSVLAAYLFHSGKHKDILTAADQAVTLARAAEDESILAEAMAIQGSGLHILGRMNDARGVQEEAVHLLERLGSVRELRGALTDLGETYLILGDLQRTRRLWERAYSLAEQVGEPASIVFAFVNLGEIMFYMGDWPAARDHLVRAAGILEGSGRAVTAAYPPLYLGMLDLAEGKWGEADRHLAACLAVAQHHGNLQALREAHRCLAERDLMEGRPEDALARLQPLLDLPGLEEAQVTRLLAPLACSYLQLGDVERAEETVMKGLERALRQSHRLALIDLLWVEGVLRIAQARWREAEHALGEAVSLARSLSYPYPEARALCESGTMHIRKGDTRQAQEPLQEALGIFQRLGARKDVERARTLLAGAGP